MGHAHSSPKFQSFSYGDAHFALFEKKFSQLYLNGTGRKKLYNSCTIIAVLMGHRLNTLKRNVIMADYPYIDEHILMYYRSVMIEANNLYKRNCDGQYLSVPEAIDLLGQDYLIREGRSRTYMKDMKIFLAEYLLHFHDEWIKSDRTSAQEHLYVVLVHQEQTSLFVFQNERVGVFDSHHHGQQGALIGTSSMERIYDLCYKFCCIMYPGRKTNPDIFELTSLIFEPKIKPETSDASKAISEE